MENKNKQTAVDWFAEQIIRKHPIITQYLPNYNFDKELIDQAKEMEKQQKIQFGYRCIGEVDAELGDLIYQKLPEEIYNEEYGK